jgi:hypothetical protein
VTAFAFALVATLLLSLPTLRRWLRDHRERKSEHLWRNWIRRHKYIRKLSPRERAYAVWLEYFILTEEFDRSLPGQWRGPWHTMQRRSACSSRTWQVAPEHRGRSTCFARELRSVAIALAGEDDPMLVGAEWMREQGYPKPPVSMLAELDEMEFEHAKAKLWSLRRDPAVLLLPRLADWVAARERGQKTLAPCTWQG